MDGLDFSEFQSGRQRNDDNCIPIFRYEPVLDQDASDVAGSNVYRDVPFVEIIIPGNSKERVIRPVAERDKIRWPEKWDRFTKSAGDGGVMEIDGTPIEAWSQITPAQAKTLRSMDIQTVEQLSTVSDLDLQSLGMGMVDLRKKAIVYVELKNDEIKVQKVASENRKLKKQVTDLEKLLGEMQSRVEELERGKHTAPNRAGTRDQGES